MHGFGKRRTILVGTVCVVVLLVATAACDELLAPAQDVYWIDVEPIAPTLQIGGVLQLTATAYDSVGFDAGEPLSDVTFSWESSDEAVATVDSDGVVTAIGVGEAWLSAEAGGTTGSTRLTVPDIYWIEVSPASDTVAVGAAVQFHAEAYDSVGFNAGVPLDGIEFEWSSSDPSVATVDQAGLATALEVGDAWIHAEAGGTTGSARLFVPSD